MMKRALSILLAVLMLFPTALSVSAESDYNDTIIDWSEHTTHVYDNCEDVSCNVCGALRAPGHVFDNACDSDCNYCDFVRSTPDHTYNHDCDETCNICGFVRPIQHQYVDCNDETCNLCGAIREAGNHVYDNACDATCNLCGATRQVDDHTYTSAVTKAPTCTAAGVKTYTCSACGDTYTENVAALGHTWNAATCTAPKTCSVCGATEGAALGHNYTNDCDTDCNRCGTIRTTEHKYDNACDTTCNVCGAIRNVGDHVYDNACDANCNICGVLRQVPDHVYDNGNDTECNICGSHRDACNHQYSNACDATCNVPGCGYIRQVGDHLYDNACDATCNICGATRQVGDHAYTSAVTEAPTCTATGVKTYTCSVCGDSYTESIDALGHIWNAATCTAPKTCSVCGATEGEALGHTYDNACDATCNVCGETRKVGDHTWENGACTKCDTKSPSKVSIKTQPKTAYAKEGATAKVTVTASGEGLTYQWYIKNAGATKYSKSSITKSAYTVTMSAKAHGRRVYCIITDQYGNTVKSSTVLVRRQATITKEPATAAYAKKGAKASIKISTLGDGLKYTWYIKNDGASKYSKSSVTSATYSVTMASKVKGRRVYCVVSDKYGKKVQSKTFILRESVSIVTQPKTVTVAKNKTAKVTVKASGDGLKYTWYIKNAGASKYSKSSITKSTYSAKMTSKVKNRLVYCVVTDKYGKTVKTVTVKLKMK